MEKISNEELTTILENHKHWLEQDIESQKDMRADLTGADLHGADLTGANLDRADLSDIKMKKISDENLEL